MKYLVLIAAVLVSQAAYADPHEERIASICKDAKEVAYSSYINAQKGTELSTTLVRLSSIYVGDEVKFAFMSRYARMAYKLDPPPIDMSLKDSAIAIAGISLDACTKDLRKVVSEMVKEDDNPKVGL